MATYYVDGDLGDDLNAGTAEGAGNAWATISKAFSTVVANDVVYVKALASGAYDEQATLSTNAAFQTAIKIQGYATTPGDQGIVRWTNTSAGYCLTTSVSFNHYYILANFCFENTVGVPIWFISNAGRQLNFYNCVFRNCGGASNGGADPNLLLHTNCLAYGSGGAGFRTGGQGRFYGCMSYNNASQAYDITTGDICEVMYKCVGAGGESFSDNASLTTGDIKWMFGCTWDAKQEDLASNLTQGCVVAQYESLGIIDNIFANSRGYGISLPTGSWDIEKVFRNNLTYNNLGAQLYTGSLQDDDIVCEVPTEGDPAFTDRDSVDYTIGAGSAAIGIGMMPGIISDEPS